MKTRIYYSGNGGGNCNPEIVLKDKANLMLTFHTFHLLGNETNSRFRGILKARQDKPKLKKKAN